MNINDFIWEAIRQVPVTCANCKVKFIDKNCTIEICPNCGESPMWEAPMCNLCEAMDDAGQRLPDCAMCDSLAQDYESNKGEGKF